MKNNNHFLTGLVIGGVAAGIAALLTAPKSGEDLCCDIADTYNNIADKTSHLTDEIKHKSWHVLHPGESCDLCESDTGSVSHFAVGAVAGAVIGAASAFLLAPKPGERLRKDIQKTYNDAMDKGEDWKEGVENFFVQLKSTLSSANKHSSKIGQIVDLANTGYTIWQKLQNRK